MDYNCGQSIIRSNLSGKNDFTRWAFATQWVRSAQRDRHVRCDSTATTTWVAQRLWGWFSWWRTYLAAQPPRLVKHPLENKQTKCFLPLILRMFDSITNPPMSGWLMRLVSHRKTWYLQICQLQSAMAGHSA